jgi:hypothetical protein
MINEVPKDSVRVAHASEAYEYDYSIFQDTDGRFWLDWQTGTCDYCGGSGVDGPYDTAEEAAKGAGQEEAYNELMEDLRGK